MLYSTQWFIVKKKKTITLRKLFDGPRPSEPLLPEDRDWKH